MSKRQISLAVLALAAAEVLFWIYTFYYIAHRTNPLGDGMEWLAEMPMTIITLASALPAALLAITGFWFRWAGPTGDVFAAGALIADAVI